MTKQNPDWNKVGPKLLKALEYLIEEVCKRNGNPFDGATDTAYAAIRDAKAST